MKKIFLTKNYLIRRNINNFYCIKNTKLFKFVKKNYFIISYFMKFVKLVSYKRQEK